MEVRQWRTIGVKRAVASTWNLLDLGSLLLFGAIIVITIAITPLNTSDSSARNCFMALLIMCAMDSVMMWSRMLHYLRAFQTTGPLVRMIMEIIKDMKVRCGRLG
jgi:cytochrome b subunit of formate dehydrogenase